MATSYADRRHRRTGLPSWSRVTLQCLDSTSEVAAHRFAAPSFDLGSSRTWSLESFLARRASALALGEARSTSTHGFSLSFRVSPETTPALRAVSRVRLRPTLSLSWGSGPFSGREHEGAGHSRRFHSPAPCVFRVRALLTPCSPSSLLAVSGEAAPGIGNLQGLVPPAGPALFRADPSPPVVARPDRDTLAVCSTGPGLLAEVDQTSDATR
jgi:hypothetical protein